MDARSWVLLILVGAITSYAAWCNPALGTAIAVGTAIVAVVYLMLTNGNGGGQP
jgi:hypothetical protein